MKTIFDGVNVVQIAGIGLLALGWYFYLGLMTLGKFPAGRQALQQAWSSGNK